MAPQIHTCNRRAQTDFCSARTWLSQSRRTQGSWTLRNYLGQQGLSRRL